MFCKSGLHIKSAGIGWYRSCPTSGFNRVCPAIDCVPGKTESDYFVIVCGINLMQDIGELVIISI